MITLCGWDRALRTQCLSTSATIGPWRRSNFRSGSQQESTLWSPVSLAAEHRYSNGDIALLKFWTGTVQSNELTFYVP